MPDQPADPLHYEMKIPPEPRKPNDAAEHQESHEGHRGSDEVTAESNTPQHTGTSPEDARRHVPGRPPRQP